MKHLIPGIGTISFDKDSPSLFELLTEGGENPDRFKKGETDGVWFDRQAGCTILTLKLEPTTFTRSYREIIFYRRTGMESAWQLTRSTSFHFTSSELWFSCCHPFSLSEEELHLSAKLKRGLYRLARDFDPASDTRVSYQSGSNPRLHIFVFRGDPIPSHSTEKLLARIAQFLSGDEQSS